MKKRRIIGVFWGRFNPPHHTHLDMVEAILKKVDKLVIAIGSAQHQDEKRNPLNGKERLLMMRAFLNERKLPMKRIKLVSVENGNDYYSSVRKLVDACPDFDLIFTDKKIALRMLKKIKPKVRQGSFRCNVKMHATQLRNAIANDEPWEHFTAKSVAKIIKRLDGMERIKNAYRKNA